MNWNTKSDEQFDKLPSQERMPDHSRDRYRGWYFPYRRVMRWIESKVGEHIDHVIHEYVNAAWIPIEFRQAHYLAKYLETNTFMEGGKVAFYDSYCFSMLSIRYVDCQVSKTFYVHPVTRLVCVFRPATKHGWNKQRQIELDKRVKILGDYHQLYKKDGVWYEVEAMPISESKGIYCASMSLFERKAPNDILLEKNGFQTRENHPFVCVTLKRQLSRKELVKHGLKNDVKI